MEAIYTSIFVEPWPWWLGGLAIGILVPLLYYFLNTPLGVSTGYASFIRLAVGRPRLRWFQHKGFDDRWGWRIFFLGGIILGAFLAGRMEGRPFFTMEMGLFTEALSWPFLLNAFYFLLGGTLLGLGARLAGACTSGHSIHGLATLQLSSLVATVSFLIGGIIISNFILSVFLGVG